MTDYRMLNAVAYERLRDMIHKNELEFDVIYSETRFAADLAISRTPVREALVRLSSEHYIDILPSRGFVLHKPTESDLLEAYHVRMASESYCSELLARENQTESAMAVIRTMRQLLERQREAGQSYQERKVDFWDLDVQFHAAAVGYLQSATFDTLFKTFMHFFVSLRIKDFIGRGRNRSTLLEHERIVRALEHGDAAEAKDAVRQHLMQSLEFSLVSLNQEDGGADG